MEGNGYCGYSMSNNAVWAYENGEKPLSKWTKSEILALCGEKKNMLAKLTVGELRKNLLYCSGWHHTSCKFNRTDFYALDDEVLEAITEEKISAIIAKRAPKAKKEAPKTVTAVITYHVWEGNYANYKKKKVYTETVTFRSDEKMICTSNGMKRLSSMDEVKYVDN